MIKVQVRPNEPLEAALRRFKRQCNYAGIFRLAKKYSFFEKRSDKKRREKRSDKKRREERERVRTLQRALRKQKQRGRPKTRRKSKVRGNNTGEESTRPSAVATIIKTPESAPAAEPKVTSAQPTVVQESTGTSEA